MSPRKSWPKSNNWTDETLRARNEIVDAELLAQEKWIRSTKEFDTMRRVVMEEKSAVYPSDHFDYAYTRNMYLHIRDLESMVIDALYQRLEQSSCFQPIYEKYLRMNEELLPSQTEKMEKVRSDLIAGKRKNMSRRQRTVVISDEEVKAELFRREDDARKQKLKAFQSVEYYSDKAQAYCDMCKLRWSKKGTVSSLPEHFTIRKWVGNQETNDISTNTNRILNFGG